MSVWIERKRSLNNNKETLLELIKAEDKRNTSLGRVSFVLLLIIGIIFHLLSVNAPSDASTTNQVFERDFLMNLSSSFYSAAFVFLLLDLTLSKRQEKHQLDKIIYTYGFREMEIREQLVEEASKVAQISKRIRRLTDYSETKGTVQKTELRKLSKDLGEEIAKSSLRQIQLIERLMEIQREMLRLAYISNNDKLVKAVHIALETSKEQLGNVQSDASDLKYAIKELEKSFKDENIQSGDEI